MNFTSLVQLLAQTHGQLQRHAMRSVDHSLVVRNWLYGFHIVTFEQKGEDRAAYGSRLLAGLSKQLHHEGIKGCSETGLKQFRLFYHAYSEIGQTVSDQLDNLSLKPTPGSTNLALSPTTLQRLSAQFPLSWSHYLVLMGLKDTAERKFYEIEASTGNWSVRDLERQIDAAVYERLSLSRNKEEIRKLAVEGQTLEKPRDALKDPCILEFLDLNEQPSYSESDLEAAIIDRLEHFLLELGKGFLFEARQKRFTFDEEHFRVDLVFYNRLLRSYVLIDLKLRKLTHQDLGQMQMYVNYFDRHVKLPEENPTIGILLCKRKKDALVELTLPKDANIFASRYQLYLPSKEDLRQQLLAIGTEEIEE